MIGSLADQPFGRLQERFGHLGPAPGIDPGEVLQGGKPIPVGRGGKVQGQAGRSFDYVIERENGEPVSLAQGVDHPCHRPAGRHDLPASHASGAVEHEHDVAGPAGELDPRWGDQRQRERSRAAVAFAVGMEGQRGVDGAAGSRLPRRNRRMKSRSRRSPDRAESGESPLSLPPGSRAGSTGRHRCNAAVARTGRSPVERRTGLGKPGSSTGGEIREASGTASVSTAVPSPTDGRRGGSWNVAGGDHQRESECDLAAGIGQHPGHVSWTVATSPGMMLPTRRVNTPGRSSSAIAALAGRDRRVVLLACLGSFLEQSLDHSTADLHAEARSPRRGRAGERYRSPRAARPRVDERLADRHLRQQAVDPALDVHRSRGEAPRGRQRPEAGSSSLAARREFLVSQLGKRPGHRVLRQEWSDQPLFSQIADQGCRSLADRRQLLRSMGLAGSTRSMTWSASPMAWSDVISSYEGTGLDLSGLAAVRSPGSSIARGRVGTGAGRDFQNGLAATFARSRAKERSPRSSPHPPRPPAGETSERRVGGTRDPLLNLGQAQPPRLELLDGHELKQVPPPVQGRSPPHLGRPIEQAHRRVIADRPQVGNVPDATVAGTLVVNGEGPLDPAPS